jgi:hypothetical protein
VTIIEALTHPSFVLGNKWARVTDSTEPDESLQCDPEGFLAPCGESTSVLILVTDFLADWELVEPETC